MPLRDLQRARDPYRERVQEQRRALRLARYEQVLALHQAGALQQEIAERLQITRATVSRYLKDAVGESPLGEFRSQRVVDQWHI